MNEKEIHNMLDDMLSEVKKRNFLNHLVRSYFPISNVEKVWEKPQGNFKCILSKEDLFSAQDILETVQSEEFKNDFMNNIKSILNTNSNDEHPIAKFIGDKKMGVTGKDTTTFMSYPAMREFYNWVLTKSLNGDKHINWLLSSIRRENQNEKLVEEKEPKNNEVKHEKPQPVSNSTFTLGELDSFKKLREKFKN